MSTSGFTTVGGWHGCARSCSGPAERSSPAAASKLSAHEEDNRIYECAVAAKAHYIVTENAKYFKQPHGYTKIVTARQLLRVLEAESV